MPDRKAGLGGRLPAQPLVGLKYVHEYATTPLPAPTYPIDVSGGITSWGMLGNDQVGDCTFAGETHYEMATAAAGHVSETWPTDQQEIAAYYAYTGGQDTGAVISQLLLYWYNAGKILAFAPVKLDKVSRDSATSAFHGLYVGVNLTDDAQTLFENHQPWTVANGETPDPNEGHCILLVKTDGATTDTYVTWGALQEATGAWSTACIEEAWVIITPEDAQAANLDVAQLRADINALGGTGGGTPSPSPSPSPSPTPTPPAPPAPPDPNLEGWWAQVVDWIEDLFGF